MGLIIVSGLSDGSSFALAQTSPQLEKVANRYWEATLARFPERATAMGDHRFNDQLTDLSVQASKAWENSLRGLLSELRRVQKPLLNEADQLTHRLLDRTIQDEILRLAVISPYMPIDPLDGIQVRFPLLLVSQPFRNIEDYRNYIKRLHGFPDQITDTINNLRDGVDRDLISPRVIVKKVIPQVRTHVVRDVTKSEFYKPMLQATFLTELDRVKIDQEIRSAIQADVIPAYLRLMAYLEDEYLPVARSTVGIGALLGGKEMYKALARLHTTVTLDPEKIHETGLAEVARIRLAFSKIQKEVGFIGTLDEFLAHMRNDPKFRFTSSEELYHAAEKILNRTKPLMPKLFGHQPRADIVMKAIEAFRALAAPVAYYNPTPEDGARPGYFYINTYAPKDRLRFTLEALTYHEAIPGHHLQMALHQEKQDLLKFRRYGSFTAFVEGWALYAEKLGYEIGGYQDAYARFGQLTFEMWRACRLVVDTGMHVKGWSRQQAIDFMATNTSLVMLDIESEIDRYITWPGQALAYKIGELRILAMRREAEEKLGDRFDLRNFHDALLAEGAMPIDMLEQRMKQWISTQP